MAGATPNLNLAFFDFGDDLAAPLNVQKEIDRFLIIDRQLFGLYNIFGNGVVSGWTVTARETSNASGISVSIAPGVGILNFVAAETTFPEVLTGLPPNSTVTIFAVLRQSTVRDRQVDFTFSTLDLSGAAAIRLASVETGAASVKTIDNTVRDEIGFKAIIKEEIDAHKHRGTPTKIDLKEETKNQLPGAKLEGIDADKIISGTFNIDRIPIIDHNDIENNGILTHAALDSFVKTLSENNKELLGEIASVNFMKQVIFLKYKFSAVDRHMINALFFIPGISPNSFIDFDSTTANMDFVEQCISGIPPAIGQFVSLRFEDNTAFSNAFKRTNVEVFNNAVTLIRDDTTKQVVEDFENVASAGAAVPGFVKTTEVVDDALDLTAEDGDTLVSEGFFSGKFAPRRTFRAVYTKTFSAAQDWTTSDELLVSVKSVSSDHKSVFAFFVNEDSSGTETNSTNFLLLAQDELTENSEPNSNNFEQKQFDISNEAKNNITKFVIFTEDTEGSFEFFVDNIFARTSKLFISQGTIKFRHLTSTPVTFHSIFFDTDTPEGTSVQVRVRVAGSPSLLSRAAFTFGLKSGDIFGLDGTAAEVEVILTTTDLTVTPTLNSVELRLLADADFNGFDINTASDWSRGALQRLVVDPSTSVANSCIIIKSPINVGGLSFSNQDAISEIDDGNIGVFGFSGDRVPISPRQALNFDADRKTGFDRAVSVVRRFDLKYIVADNRNDRVFELDTDGNVLRGLGSVRVQDADFYPLSSVYNPVSGILTVTFTGGVAKDSVDLTKMSLFIGATELKLDKNDTVLDNSKSTQILEIRLSSDKFTQLIGITSNLFVDFRSGAFAQDVVLNENAQSLFGVFGIEVFVGDFKYIDQIERPIFADLLENENWIIGNSSVNFDPGVTPTTPADTTATSTLPTVPSIVEFDYDNELVDFSSDLVSFSDFSLGGIAERSTERLAVAGIFESDAALGSDQASTDTASSETTTSKVVSDPARQAFLDAAVVGLESFRGVVAVIDKSSNNLVFRYTSPDGLYPSDVDIRDDGNLVVAESAFASAGGRVVILDSFGNIIFQHGNGSFNVVNDAKVRTNNNVVVSI